MRYPTALSMMLACLVAAPPAWAGAVRTPFEAARSEVQARAGQTLPVIEIAHEKIVLPNGLTLIVHEDHTTPVVSVGVWYHVGSANEVPGRTGFAHLFEHLMFNGSENANTDWFAAMNAVGATGMNGSTSYDRTNYYQTVPTGALDRALWLESDRMGHLLPVVDQARLDEQRRVVQNEKRQRENTPLGEAPDMIAAATYPEGHPYSWTPIGSMEDLEAATLEDVHAFFNRWYGAANAVVVLSGDVTVEQAREKVERYFGDIPAGPPLGRSREQIARMIGETRGSLEARTANPLLMKVWNVPGWASHDAQLLELAEGLLGRGPNSRLQKRLVRELELATGVEVGLQKLELGSQFIVQVTARPGVDLARVEEALNAEMAAFLAEGAPSTELDRLRFEHYGSSVRGLTSTMEKGMILAESELYAGSPDFYRTRLATLFEATPADVQDAARRWLSGGSYVLEVLPLPAYTTASEASDRSAPPAIGAPAPFNLPPLQHATLSNGIKVALAERHDVPTVNLSMIFDVGSLPDRNPASVGLSTAVVLTTTGTRSRSDLEIAARGQELGALFNWQTSSEHTRFGLNALKLSLEESLDLYVDILRNPTFPDAEWERLRAIFTAQYEDNTRSAQGKLAMIAPAVVYGPDHPYAAQLTPDVAARLTTDDFRRFYAEWIRPDLATLMVVGDTTLEEIVPLLERRLADWRAPDSPAPVKPALPEPAGEPAVRVILIDQPGSESSLIAATQRGPVRSDPDYDAQDLVNTLMGGTFVSRLNMNLREDKGWSYGANASIEAGVLLGRVSAGAAVQTDRTADALREIERELREVGTSRPPTLEEIAVAKNDMLLGLPASLQGSGGMLTMYRTAYEHHLPDDYWNTYVQRIQALTPDEVEAAATRLYDPSTLTWFVVGDLARIEADVRALNLGPVEVLDIQGRRVR